MARSFSKGLPILLALRCDKKMVKDAKGLDSGRRDILVDSHGGRWLT